MIKNGRQFKALGFIEVLIAIVVVSIVSAVFLSIAGNAMKDLIQTERMEIMARIAKDGVNIAQEVANRDKADLLGDKNFPETTGHCYIPFREEGGDPVYKFARDGEEGGPSDAFTKFPTGQDDVQRGLIIDKLKGPEGSKYIWNEEYFMVMCLLSVDTGTTWAHVKFWVGDMNVAGQVTNNSDMRDFIYYAVIEL